MDECVLLFATPASSALKAYISIAVACELEFALPFLSCGAFTTFLACDLRKLVVPALFILLHDVQSKGAVVTQRDLVLESEISVYHDTRPRVRVSP